MRTNKTKGTLRLDQQETRIWRKGVGASARGIDMGRRWMMRRDLEETARYLAESTGAESIDVLLCDGTLALTVARTPPAPKKATRARSMLT